MRQIYRPLIIALTASVLLSACEKAPAPTQATVNYSAEQQQLLQQGSQRARSCAACHGPAGISSFASGVISKLGGAIGRAVSAGDA
ncbi:hypothetical protein [Alishewanella longhuensis]